MTVDKKKLHQMMEKLVAFNILEDHGKKGYTITKDFDTLFRGHLLRELRKQPSPIHLEQNITTSFVEALDDCDFIGEEPNVEEVNFAVEILRTFSKEGIVEKLADLLGL